MYVGCVKHMDLVFFFWSMSSNKQIVLLLINTLQISGKVLVLIIILDEMYSGDVIDFYIFNKYMYEQKLIPTNQPISKWLKVFEHDSWTESYFMMNVLKSENFPYHISIRKEKQVGTYVFDYKLDIEMATLLLATKAHRNIKYQMLTQHL